MMSENRLGGRGECSICKKWVDNVSYHEAWECDGDRQRQSWDGIHMDIVSKFFWGMENEKKQMKFDFMGD